MASPFGEPVRIADCFIFTELARSLVINNLHRGHGKNELFNLGNVLITKLNNFDKVSNSGIRTCRKVNNFLPGVSWKPIIAMFVRIRKCFFAPCLAIMRIKDQIRRSWIARYVELKIGFCL